jgi:hypothetical protein
MLPPLCSQERRHPSCWCRVEALRSRTGDKDLGTNAVGPASGFAGGRRVATFGMPCQVSLEEGAARSGIVMNSEATLRRLRAGENAAKPGTPRRLLQVRPRLLRLPPGRDWRAQSKGLTARTNDVLPC